MSTGSVYAKAIDAFNKWQHDDTHAKGYSPDEYKFASDVTGGYFDDRAASFYAGYMAAINKKE